MPRPGLLTKSSANRMKRTPGARVVLHKRKHYKTGGTCFITGSELQLSRESKHGVRSGASLSSKRPNRPYGGVISSRALRRGIIKASRD